MSGKYSVTTLTGTRLMRGSNAAVVLVEEVAFDDESSPHAADERSAIATLKSIAARGPRWKNMPISEKRLPLDLTDEPPERTATTGWEGCDLARPFFVGELIGSQKRRNLESKKVPPL
jgi:hypothetical protein